MRNKKTFSKIKVSTRQKKPFSFSAVKRFSLIQNQPFFSSKTSEDYRFG